MGAGKTTLGKQLSEKLSIPFIDSDQEIEKKMNKTIVQLFKELGESKFRILESEFIHGLSKTSSFVLATGGGLPCFYDNILFLNDLGITIYLKTSSEILTNRILNDINRPLIKGKNKEELNEFVTSSLLERECFYEKSRFILDENHHDIDSILQIINQ
jgi:shikimate kinase